MTESLQPSPFLTDIAPRCPAHLLERARRLAGGQMRLAIAGADSRIAVETAMMAMDAGIALPHLIGSPELIKRHAEALGWDMGDIPLVSASGEDEIMAATMGLVRGGDVGAVMKGHIHTDRFMAGVLHRDGGIRSGQRMVHVFAMFPADGGKPLLIADAAVNVLPDRKTSEAVLIELARTARALGIERPKIAVVSATETPIASMPSSLAARELALWGSGHIPEADISGPLSFDLAISPEAVAVKGLEGDPVAGYADALMMPEITSGNVLFKALVWLKGACAAGVVAGGRMPVMLTSRADPPAARLASVALAALLVVS